MIRENIFADDQLATDNYIIKCTYYEEPYIVIDQKANKK